MVNSTDYGCNRPSETLPMQIVPVCGRNTYVDVSGSAKAYLSTLVQLTVFSLTYEGGELA